MAAVLLLTLLLLMVAYHLIGSHAISLQVGQQEDRRFVRDAHEIEQLGSVTGRWTTGDTRLLLPPPAAHTPLLLSLTLLNARPAGAPDPQLDLSVQNQALASVAVTRAAQGARRYHLLLPAQNPWGWAVEVGLTSDTVRPPGDARDLGFMLVGARLRPLGSSLLPPMAQLIAWFALAAASLVALWGLGLRPLLAGGTVAIGLALLAAGLAMRPLEIAPFTPRLAAAAGLAAIYGTAVAALFRGQLMAATTRPSGLADHLLPVVLLMGLAYWLMPVFQLVMTADGVNGVTPAPATMVIGSVGLLAAGFVLLWQRSAAPEGRLRWLAGVLAVAALAHLVAMIQFAFTRSGPDFWILFKGTREWARGGALYDLAGIELNHFGHTFKVPPFYGMLFLPFVTLDGFQVLLGHRILNTVLAATAFLLWLRAFRLPLLSTAGTGLLLAFNLRPLSDTIAFGQIDIVLLLLLLLALLASRRGYDGLAGAAVAAGTLFKLYPAVLLAFFVAKRQWRALIGFVVGMLLLNGLAVAVMGWEVHRTYLFDVLPRIGGGTAWVENQTLNGVLSRWAGGEIASNKFDNPLVSLATYAAFGLGVGLATLLSLDSFERQAPQYALQFAQFTIIMVLLVPAAWMHYATITILAFAAVLLVGAEQPWPRGRAAAMGLAYGLIAYGNQWSFFGGAIMGSLTLLGISYKFYGLVLLAGVCGAMLMPQTLRLAVRGWRPNNQEAEVSRSPT